LAVSTEGLPLKRACELDQEPPEERWLLAGLWARSAIGLIGGAPKCCKTWLALDMAVSVASATPALGRFACECPGPALVYLAEDGLPQVRARIEALCRERGADIRSLDLSVITAPILRLDLASDQERLARTIEVLRPRMLLLDPLVRLHRLDENSAAEISGLLGYIRDLQRRFDLAVVLVHHASKKQRSQPGQALRGSSDLHAIGDSNAYLARDGQHIVLTIEHRAAPAPEPLRIELVADQGGEATSLRVLSSPPQAHRPDLDQLLLDRLAPAGEPISRAALRAELRVNNQRLGEALERLEHNGRIQRTPQGWLRR